MIYVYALEVPGEVKGGRKRFGAAASCATEGPLSGNDHSCLANRLYVPLFQMVHVSSPA